MDWKENYIKEKKCDAIGRIRTKDVHFVRGIFTGKKLGQGLVTGAPVAKRESLRKHQLRRFSLGPVHRAELLCPVGRKDGFIVIYIYFTAWIVEFHIVLKLCKQGFS